MSKLVLVTGATGYVATRLIPALLARGYRVRCLVRNPDKLRNRPWKNQVEVCLGDVLDKDSLSPTLAGVKSAYYLIHNMASGSRYREYEQIGAQNFGEASFAAGLEHIIYLGGLGGSEKFRHMQSRQATGRILRQSGVPITEFRTSVIIGSGSISFELIRSLTTFFPFIPAPLQTNRPGQPIGIKSLLEYLTLALETPECRGRLIEIGGPELVHYPEMMSTFASIKGLWRPKLPLPFYSAFIAAKVAGLLTPVPYKIAHPLMEELTAPSIVQDRSAGLVFPGVFLSDYRECVQAALDRVEYSEGIPWAESLLTRAPLVGDHVRTLGEGLLIDNYEIEVKSPPTLLNTDLAGQIIDNWNVDAQLIGNWIRILKNNRLIGKSFIEISYKNNRVIVTIMLAPTGALGLIWWYLFSPWYLNLASRGIQKLLE
jgi:uncharacterized protein YbjT (DUF2867 family)